MLEEILHHRGTTLVRRLTLNPGEVMNWHRDPYHRVTVVLRGESITIEYQDGTPEVQIPVIPGQVDWDEPSGRVHRARNDSDQVYEEVTVFFLDRPDAAHQPVED
jgi:quercetin dioxygenase-like cupin family protein